VIARPRHDCCFLSVMSLESHGQRLDDDLGPLRSCPEMACADRAARGQSTFTCTRLDRIRLESGPSLSLQHAQLNH
jgi:hypothetical protein